MIKDLRCVIFDMDGVIVNTEPLHKNAYFKTFESLNLNVSDKLYHSFVGSSTLNAFEKLVKHFNLTINPKELVKKKRHFFKDSFKTDPPLELIKGVKDIITYFYEKEITLVLASSASHNTINLVNILYQKQKLML